MSAFNTILWTSTLAGPLLVGGAERLGQREFTAPPTPPDPVHASEGSAPRWRAAAAATYSIGDPTPEEQLYVEMINRARANPSAEALLFRDTTDPDLTGNYDFFDVDLAKMLEQFALIPAAPPVAPNAQLTVAARRHSADMLAKSFQAHEGSDNSTFIQRATAAGYLYSTIAENVYANAESVFHGHAGFDVDWGVGQFGMQTPPGHRNTIHNSAFREVGVGVSFGRNQPAAGSQGSQYRPVGPQLVTQEFGTGRNSTPFITGVVYFDLNGNNFYDLGEGVGGVRVIASGTTTDAVTARSGGYAIPVAGNGPYTVTFSGPGLVPFTREVVVAQNANQKLDFRPAYATPAVTGSLVPAINAANSYQISAVPGASAYQWRSFEMAIPAIEGAENGAAKVTIAKTGDYSVFETSTRKSGTYSFHLAHPLSAIEEQSIVLHPSYLVNANSVLRFESRLGWATAKQTAVVQISTDNGANWQEVYEQSGTGAAGERAFQSRSIALSAFAGATIQVRFAYVPSGSVFVDTDNETGWFIDDITLGSAFEISNEQVSDAPNGSFSFQPQVIADFILQGRARTGHDYLPWGTSLAVRSAQGTTTPAELRVDQIQVASGQVQIEIELVSGTAPGSFTLQTKAALDAPRWLSAAATVTPISSSRFRLVAPIGAGGSGFFRVQGN